MIVLKLTCYREPGKSSLDTRVEEYAGWSEVDERLRTIAGPASVTLVDSRWNGEALLVVLDGQRAHLTFFGSTEEHDMLCAPGESAAATASGSVDVGWGSYPACSVVDRAYALAVASEIVVFGRLPACTWAHYRP